jgi:sulfhydrogenase subunit beta (sulfur reductase)
MKVIKINKEAWARGLERLYDSFRLFGPVKQDEFHNFRQLVKGELPDLNLLNTRLSAKSIIYPQSEKMFEFTLDENRDDHHILRNP